MTIDLPSAAAGFALGSGVLAFLARWIFATKAELSLLRADLAESVRSSDLSLLKHEREERERSEAMVRRLFDKIDEMSKEIVAARLEIAGLPKYSRTGAISPEGGHT